MSENMGGGYDSRNEPWLDPEYQSTGIEDLIELRDEYISKLDQHIQALPDDGTKRAFLESLLDQFDIYTSPSLEDDSKKPY